jgi:hypothetical protein
MVGIAGIAGSHTKNHARENNRMALHFQLLDLGVGRVQQSIIVT